MSESLAAASLGGWNVAPGVTLPLAVTIALYVRGRRVLRARRMHGRSATDAVDEGWRVAAFGGACAALAVALLSPLDAISDDLFTAHMIQHELLMAVAAPLFVAARPGVPMLWALPLAARRAIGRVLASVPTRTIWRALTRPFDAWLLHAAVIWVWHIPRCFQFALESEAIHVFQHVSFLGSGLLFWWAIVHPRRRAALGLSIVYLFTTALHTAALGALLATAHAPWYPAYGERATHWGFTALEDQQLAGLVMWIPAGAAYLIAALLIVRRWLRATGWQLQNIEPAESPEAIL